MHKYTFHFILSAALLLLISCSSGPATDVATLPAIPVTVRSAGESTNGATLAASGRIEAVQSANLSTRVMGYVTGIHVKVGEQVKEGQQLATISSADLDAQRKQAQAGVVAAQAAFSNAQKDLDRFTALFAKNSATRKELDDITTHYTMAKAALEAAKRMNDGVDAQLAYTRITAPFGGTVTNTFVKEGEMASPGMPILAVEGRAELQAVVLVPESSISQVASGAPATITVRSLGRTLQGTVAEVSTSARNTGGQYVVKINLPNVGKGILSGMFVDAAISKNDTTGAGVPGPVEIPTAALVYKGQLEGVYVVTTGQVALLRWLRLGKTTGDRVEVLSGLAPDEHYVLHAEGRLHNGSKVSITGS